MIRLGQQHGIPRARLLAAWAEDIGAAIAGIILVLMVAAACGAFPRGLADMHFAIITNQQGH